MNYIATFYTHAAALMTHRSLKNKAIPSKLAPVPRVLSSSCGTCVMYASEDPNISEMDQDVEAVYEATGSGYRQLLRKE